MIRGGKGREDTSPSFLFFSSWLSNMNSQFESGMVSLMARKGRKESSLSFLSSPLLLIGPLHMMYFSYRFNAYILRLLSTRKGKETEMNIDRVNSFGPELIRRQLVAPSLSLKEVFARSLASKNTLTLFQRRKMKMKNIRGEENEIISLLPPPPHPPSHQITTNILHTNPHHAHNNIHPLPLPSLEFIAPHPIPLIIPISSTSTMHASPAHFPRLTLSTLTLLSLTARIAQVLNDGAVDGEFVAVSGSRFGVFCVLRGGRRCGFGDERLENFVDDAVVPCCG